MAREVKNKFMEVGVGSILYLLALFAVRHWDVVGGAELFVYLLAYTVSYTHLTLPTIRLV